jgi:hypothetical protein
MPASGLIKPKSDVAVVPPGIRRRQTSSEVCKVFPGDDDWPSQTAWAQLNETVGGALFIPVPRAAVCHSLWPQYDPAKCEDLLANWNNFEDRYVINHIVRFLSNIDDI